MEQQNTTSQQESDSHITLKSILGGDILAHSFLKRQANLLILIVLLTILYIELTERSRQSRIEEYIATEGTPLQTAATPPYLIKKED